MNATLFFFLLLIPNLIVAGDIHNPPELEPVIEALGKSRPLDSSDGIAGISDVDRLAFKERVSKAMLDVENGNTEAAHFLLNQIQSISSNQYQCKDILDAFKRKYGGGDYKPKFKQLIEERAASTSEMVRNWSTLSKELQKEYWRRINTIVQAGEGLWSTQQVSEFVSTYAQAPNESIRMGLARQFLSIGVQKEKLAKVLPALTLEDAFPCDEGMARTFVDVGKMLSPHSKLTLSDGLFARALASGPIRSTSTARKDFEKTKEDFKNSLREPFNPEDYLNQYNRTVAARNTFVASFSTKNKRIPGAPTAAQYASMLLNQMKDASLSEDNRARAKSDFDTLMRAFAHKLSNGDRVLTIDDQQVKLTPDASVEGDAALLRGRDLSLAEISAVGTPDVRLHNPNDRPVDERLVAVYGNYHNPIFTPQDKARYRQQYIDFSVEKGLTRAQAIRNLEDTNSPEALQIEIEESEARTARLKQQQVRRKKTR